MIHRQGVEQKMGARERRGRYGSKKKKKTPLTRGLAKIKQPRKGSRTAPGRPKNDPQTRGLAKSGARER